MKIDIKMCKDFEICLDELKRKYGEDFEYLNGIHESQTNFSDFIDAIANKNISDVTIDSNANASNKDIVSVLSEKGKSIDKLFAANKIFYEIKKKYGLKTARDWLESEYVGAFYLHDFPSSSYKSYCFSGDTKILTNYGILPLRSLVGQNIKVLNKNHGWEEATVQHFGKDRLFALTLERFGVYKTISVTANHLWYIKEKKGITKKRTDELKVGDKIPFNTSKVWSQVLPSPFGVAHGFFIGVTGNEREYTTFGIPKSFNCLPDLNETPSYLYGWLSGYFAADGSVDEKGRCTIASTSIDNLECVRNILCVLGMPVNEIRSQTRISNLTNDVSTIYILSLSSGYLKPDFFILPIHKERFEKYYKSEDKRDRSWKVVSVKDTNVIDDVYCAVVPETHSFTLDNNILTHNCFAYDLTRLATEGLFFLDHYNNEPPKHLTTFFDDAIEFVSYFSNRSSGAVGLPNVLIWSYYFWVHDVKNKYYINDPKYYLKQNFQKFIYRLNQPFMRVDQSAFVNVSIFDREYLHGLFDGVIYPDGSMVVDNIEEIIEHQKIFMEVVSEIRQQNLFTFPVLTYSLLYKNGKFVDEDFARWCSDHNVTWNDSNFFIGDNVGVLSNCCFSGDQMCLTKSTNGVNYMTFKQLYDVSDSQNKKNFAVFHNGSWVKGKIIRLPKRDMYKIVTSNKKEVYVTDNHIFPTLHGDKTVTDLTTDDYLMFNCRKLDAVNERNEHLSYEQGYLIGMYLGDGSCYQKTENHTPVIRLSLNQSKYNNTLSIIQKAVEQIDNQADYVLHKPCNNGYPTAITSWGVTNFIKKYVIGSHANEKELNMDCLLQSYDFRKGILDGYYMTDGGNSHRIYTTSKKLAYQTECLITSLGMNSIINITDRTDEPVIIRGNTYKRNYPLYCIKWYSPMNNRAHNGSGFKFVNNSEYYKITSIERMDYDDDYVYCFEMKNEEEPYFTLPNGIITHNCRLLSDTRKLDAFINSIGGTALSIGSIKVNTINLVRIFYEAGADEEKYLDLLRKRVILCCKTLDRVRHIIKRNIEKGLLPNFQDGGVELDKCYNTVGIIGLYEVIRNFGYTQTDEFGYVSYTDKGIEFAEKIFNIINDTKDNFTDEYSINVESVPAERAAIILCAKDRALYELDNDDFIYANQWIPLMTKCSFKEKLRLSSILDRKCGGGVISHINLESNFPNTDTAWEMLNRIAAAGVIYFAFNNRINECRNHHGFVGTDICPTCGEPVYDTYSRIVGFLVPTRAYSKDRYKEFNVRQWYTEAELRSE